MPNFFDLHVVANALPPRLDALLQALGYEHRRVVGCEPRVCLKYLLSLKQPDRKSADIVYSQTIRAIEQTPSFNGYVEEEVTAYDLFFRGATNGPEVETFPLNLTIDDCAPGILKKCDVHVTTTHDYVAAIRPLREAGFYYQIFQKSGVGQAHVASMQAESLILGKQVWAHVIQFLDRNADFTGHAKFEVALKLRNFGFRLPPIVRDVR